MGNINVQRVLLGGLLAGLIIDISEYTTNGVILASQWRDAMKHLGAPAILSVKQIVALNVWGFLTGIAMIWLYAAIRPRFGEGPKTAAIAGAAMWFMNYALGSSFPVITHLFPLGLAVLTTVIGLAEAVVAALAGAWLYREESQPELKNFRAAAR